MAAANDFSSSASGLTSPARNAFAITKSDSLELSHVTRGIYVGGAGDIAVITVGGDTVTFSACVAGSIIPVCVKQVLSAGTTATLLLGLY